MEHCSHCGAILRKHCYYCGGIADTKDHIPPQTVRKRFPELALSMAFETIDCCRRCNGLLCASYPWSKDERRAKMQLFLTQESKKKKKNKKSSIIFDGQKPEMKKLPLIRPVQNTPAISWNGEVADPWRWSSDVNYCTTPSGQERACPLVGCAIDRAHSHEATLEGERQTMTWSENTNG